MNWISNRLDDDDDDANTQNNQESPQMRRKDNLQGFFDHIPDNKKSEPDASSCGLRKTRSCFRKNVSMPNLRAADTPSNQKIKFSTKPSIVKIDSHHDLSELERSSLYYDRGDMNGFVKNELTRRSKIGITSTNALAPEAGNLDDKD
mmetsp:Transcript_179/g.199  ORF Transcript_179/g.199 Transcript_179/m.199 type:complete len:147 (+) Transcript_179:2-442(+)